MIRRWWRVPVTTLLAVLVLLPGVDARAAQLVHVVQPDDTLESIARRYGIDPSRLAEQNGLSWPYALQVGQTLLVAGQMAGSIPQPRPQPVPAPRTLDGLTLLPVPTQTLYSIAWQWQYDAGAGLVQWTRPLASLAPRPGFALLVPVRAPGAQAQPRQACIEWPAAGEALVARVNDWGIGLRAFERRWNEVLGGLRYAGVNIWSADFRAIEPQARRSVLNEMIDQVLVQQWAARTGTTVSAAEIDAWLQAGIEAAGGNEPFSVWLAERQQTWEGYQQQGCYELLRQALAQRLTRGSPDPEIRAEAVATWLSQGRSVSRIELYAAVAGAADDNWTVAEPADRPGVSRAP